MAKTVFAALMQIPSIWLNKVFSHRHDGLDADGSAPLNYAEAAGDGAAYTASFTPALTAHITGMPVIVKILAANTSTTPTINPDTIGAKQIQRKNGVPLCVGDMPANLFAVLVYNGSSYDLINSYLLLDAAVTTSKIMDVAVTTAKLAAEAVTTAKIADLNVTTGKIADAAVTTVKVAAGAITPDKITRSAGVEVFDHFLLSNLVGWTNHAGGAAIISGSNGWVRITADATAAQYGISQFVTLPFKISGGNTLTFEAKIKTSAGSIVYFQFGLMDTDVITAGNRIMFMASGPGAVRVQNSSAGTFTDSGTDVNWNINTTYKFKFVVTASQILFYINDVLKATHTTNIPTVNMGVGLLIAASNTYADVDYVHCTSDASV